MRISEKKAREMGIPVPDRPRKTSESPWRTDRRECGKRIGKDGTGGDPVFDALCVAHGLPEPVTEYIFAKWKGGKPDCSHRGRTYACKCGATRRRWRFDYLFDGWLAVEKQGGLFSKGRHVRGKALLAEYEKLNEAAILGYTVLFLTPKQFEAGEAFAIIKRALSSEDI
jgi:hypothetical protein